MSYRTNIDIVEVSVRTTTGEWTTSQTNAVFEEEDMWAVVPSAPLPSSRLNVPEVVTQPSRPGSKPNVWLAVKARSLSVWEKVTIWERVSAPSSSAVTSTRKSV